MPRDLPVGNGKLLICFDRNYAIRELYFPHIGLENHVGGKFCRMGVWVDGQFSWVGPEWDRDLRYLPDTLVTDVKLSHAGLGVALECRDAVDFHEDSYLREIVVTNISPQQREIRLFFTLDLGIYGNELGDTAGFDPKTGAVVHYKGARYFLTGGMAGEGKGLSQFAVGQKDSGGLEGTFKDAEDGELSGNPIAQGSVDSVIGLTLTLPPYESGQAYYWLVVGQSWEDVVRLDALVKHKHPRGHLKRTEDYWRLWVRKESPGLEHLPEPVAELYRRSLLVVRTQIDWQGGILAANDSDVVYFNRDTYSYVWPRTAPWWLTPWTRPAIRPPPGISFSSSPGSCNRKGVCCTSSTLTAPWPPPGIPGTTKARPNCPSRRTPLRWWSGPCGSTSYCIVTWTSSSPYTGPW